MLKILLILIPVWLALISLHIARAESDPAKFGANAKQSKAVREQPKRTLAVDPAGASKPSHIEDPNATNRPTDSNILSGTPVIVAWSGLAIAVLTLIYNLVRLGLEVIQQRRSRRISIIDDYWFRDVLMPVSIQPVIDFIIKTASDLTEYKHSQRTEPEQAAFYDERFREFTIKKETMISRLMILAPIDAAMYKAATDGVDKMEDIVTLHCYATGHQPGGADKYLDVSYTVREIYNQLNEIVIALIARHHARFK